MSGKAYPQGAMTSNDWLTPEWVIGILGPFDLDPCTNKKRPWPTAELHLWRGGLERKWWGRVWLNPPYGREIAAWMEKMARHGNGIALIFARTDTRWFQRWVFDYADAVLFHAGRISFCYPNGVDSGKKIAASAFVAYGDVNVERLQTAKLPGKLVTL